MTIFQSLVAKNNQIFKYILVLIFSLALLSDLAYKLQFRSTLGFHISWFQIELFVLIGLLFFNFKGIKIIVSCVLLFLLISITITEFVGHLSTLSIFLILKNVFQYFDVDSSIIFLFHVLMYITLLFFMFIKPSKLQNNKELIDQ